MVYGTAKEELGLSMQEGGDFGRSAPVQQSPRFSDPKKGSKKH